MKIPASDTSSVGIREFRAALAEYIDADRPVTVTRHGQAVGLFVPLRRPNVDDLHRLQEAAANFRKAMPLSDDEVESMVAEFDTLRRASPPPARSAK